MAQCEASPPGHREGPGASRRAGGATAPYVYVPGPRFQARTGTQNPFTWADLPAHASGAGKSVYRIVCADFNGDGKLDCVNTQRGACTATCTTANDVLKYYENNGTAQHPSFRERTGSANPFAGIAHVSFCADFNGDGKVDCISTSDQSRHAALEPPRDYDPYARNESMLIHRRFGPQKRSRIQSVSYDVLREHRHRDGAELHSANRGSQPLSHLRQRFFWKRPCLSLLW